jgi:hypothetical protein
VGNRRQRQSVRLATAACSLHIRVRAFAIFGDEAVDPRRHNGQRDRAELEHSIVESADVEFETRSFQLARRYPRNFTFYVADPISSIRFERFLRFFAGTHDRKLAHIIREGLPGPGDVTATGFSTFPNK